ncbi:MAG: ExbD/TolR family protein [Tepidisphaeraceae bacterium]
MKKHHMPESHGGHPNVVPLIDVIMCLIVFFMLVAKIGVDTGGDKSIAIPASVLGTEIKDMGNTLTINVQPIPNANDPFVTAMVKGKREELKIVEPATKRRPLLESLKFFRFGNDLKKGGSGPGADNEDFKVIIRGDGNMDYRYLEPVLITCAEAEVKNVNFVTSKVEQEAPAPVAVAE